MEVSLGVFLVGFGSRPVRGVRVRMSERTLELGFRIGTSNLGVLLERCDLPSKGPVMSM